MVVGGRLWATYCAMKLQSNIIARYMKRMSVSLCYAEWLHKLIIMTSLTYTIKKAKEYYNYHLMEWNLTIHWGTLY